MSCCGTGTLEKLLGSDADRMDSRGMCALRALDGCEKAQARTGVAVGSTQGGCRERLGFKTLVDLTGRKSLNMLLGIRDIWTLW